MRSNRRLQVRRSPTRWPSTKMPNWKRRRSKRRRRQQPLRTTAKSACFFPKKLLVFQNQFFLKNTFHRYTWRTDLAKSEEFWPGWFQDLSSKFLDVRVPKLLLLASIDGLDRTLTVGQMQGKFQMKVLARCGHVVHEDRPHEVAEVIASYMVRNKFAEPSSEFHRQMPECWVIFIKRLSYS